MWLKTLPRLFARVEPRPSRRKRNRRATNYAMRNKHMARRAQALMDKARSLEEKISDRRALTTGGAKALAHAPCLGALIAL